MDMINTYPLPIGQLLSHKNSAYAYRPKPRLTDTIGHLHDQDFITDLRAPDLLKRSLLRVYQLDNDISGRRISNLNHLQRKDSIKAISHGLKLTTDEAQIKEQAIFHVNAISSLLVNGVMEAAKHIKAFKLPVPWSVAEREAKNNDGYIEIDGPTYKRLTNDKWMVRALRKEIRNRIELIALKEGVINSTYERYASDQSVKIHEQARARNYALLDALQATNEEGDHFSLLELSEKSVSNPDIRSSELFVRTRGFENYANKHNHIADFWTLTCPSKFHRSSSKWNGSTPKDAQKWFCKQWGKFRSSIDKTSHNYYGLRVVEPHKDACPHWHMLLFFETEEGLEFARQKMQHYLLSEDGDEAGAQEHRFVTEKIDKSKGSATGYIAKYIAKNINGSNIEDVDGRDPVNAALRAKAWSSNWRIRQFQQIGGPSVTVWRELRRMETEEIGELEECRKAADSSDWSEYFEAQGGHSVNFKDMPVKPAYWLELDTRLSNVPRNEYGEPIGPKVFGVTYRNTYYLTRYHTWCIEKSDTGPIDLPVPIGQTLVGTDQETSSQEGENYTSSPIGDSARKNVNSLPWSSVNNCTG